MQWPLGRTLFRSGFWNKQNAYGRRNFEDSTILGQTSCLLVDAKYDDRVGVLVRGVETRSRGVDGEVARRLALRGDAFDIGECALAGIDAEDRDTVGAAIRGVKEIAVGMDRDFRPAFRAGEVLGESGKRLLSLSGCRAASY